MSSQSTVVRLVEVTTAPLGFFVLALVIVETFLGTVLLGGELPGEDKVILVYLGVCMFVLVVGVVTTLVWRKPQNLVFDKEAYTNQLKAAVSLGAASTSRPKPTTDADIEKIAKVVRATGRAGAEPDGEWKNRILWVDDRPSNNQYERLAFEAMGVRVTLAQTTGEGLERLQQDRYGAIISDMERREGPREGYVLLDRLREQGNRTPLFFYTSSNAPDHKRQTREHGGQGLTNNPEELFEMVIAGLS